VPKAKAGVGSAVNDATRLLGGTLGVAILGSVYASLYASRLTAALPAHLPGALARTAHQSVGAALTVASLLGDRGQLSLAAQVHDAGSGAFIHGLSVACLVAAAVAGAGAVMAAALLPAQPPQPAQREPEAEDLPIRATASPAVSK
jgi:hypothetical protein